MDTSYPVIEILQKFPAANKSKTQHSEPKYEVSEDGPSRISNAESGISLGGSSVATTRSRIRFKDNVEEGKSNKLDKSDSKGFGSRILGKFLRSHADIDDDGPSITNSINNSESGVSVTSYNKRSGNVSRGSP